MDTHGFGVNRVHGEQQGRDQAGGLILKHAAHSQEEYAHDGMEDDVEEVVGGGAQLAEEVVQSESEYRERPVRFVAPLLCGGKNGYKHNIGLLMREELEKLSSVFPLSKYY